jgi:hypothetical protein
MSDAKIKSAIAKLNSEGIELFKTLQTAKSDVWFFRYKYQSWYSKAIKSIEFLAPDRLQEFKSYYEINPKRKSLGYGTFVIQDYFKGVAPNEIQHPDFNSINQVLICCVNQLTILQAAQERIDSVLQDLRGVILADLQDEEIATANALKKVNLRAAGALSGVIVERHLLNVVANHGISISKRNSTIANLNEALKAADIIDIPTWRKISYLADLRNLCSHKKDKDPSTAQVDELLDGIAWLVKNVT